MAQYALLIYSEPGKGPQPETPAFGNYMEAYGAYTAMLKEKKLFVAGEALTPTTTATTVRLRNDDIVTSDGPFAETKEQLGGFYIVEAANLDDAIAAAAKTPTAAFGSIEVRPIMTF